MTIMNHVSEGTKATADVLSVTTAVATIAGLLPAVAALLTIVWTGIRIYETRTVQRLLGRDPAPTVSEE